MTETDGVPLSVEGLLLPRRLVLLLSGGRWTAPDDAVLRRVFPEPADFPSFYDAASIVGVNRGWHSESRAAYVCRPDAANPPGDIDPARSLLIGELGPDQMFALDYRRPGSPGVVYLAEPGWVEVAPDFDAFADRLGL